MFFEHHFLEPLYPNLFLMMPKFVLIYVCHFESGVEVEVHFKYKVYSIQCTIWACKNILESHTSLMISYV